MSLEMALFVRLRLMKLVRVHYFLPPEERKTVKEKKTERKGKKDRKGIEKR